MAEIVVKLPKCLEGEVEQVKRRVSEEIAFEAKRRALLDFIDEVMKGAKQLSDEELVRLGKEIKKGRSEKLRKRGLV